MGNENKTTVEATNVNVVEKYFKKETSRFVWQSTFPKALKQVICHFEPLSVWSKINTAKYTNTYKQFTRFWIKIICLQV
jgi:hypothetical protein